MNNEKYVPYTKDMICIQSEWFSTYNRLPGLMFNEEIWSMNSIDLHLFCSCIANKFVKTFPLSSHLWWLLRFARSDWGLTLMLATFATHLAGLNFATKPINIIIIISRLVSVSSRVGCKAAKLRRVDIPPINSSAQQQPNEMSSKKQEEATRWKWKKHF